MKRPVLLTQKDRKSFPSIYSREADEDPIVRVKFFTPDANATWFALEFDGVDEFFGWACLGDVEMGELGYFSLSELQEIRGPMGLPVERDMYFKPCPLSEAKGSVRGWRLGQNGQSQTLDGARDDNETPIC
jgi:Protein of unknown function (DUF2958)